jgi:hypothetical protein
MATKTWVGRAAPTRHRYEFTISATGAAGTKWWVSVSGRTGPTVLVASGETTATLATKVAAAYSAASAEFSQMTWDAAAGVVTVDGPADGHDPGLVMANDAAAAFTAAEPIVGTGPSHWDDAENWLEGSVPASTDDLVFRGGAAVKYGLPGTGTGFGTVTFTAESAGAGLPEQNPAGYVEYLSARRVLLNCGNVAVQTAALVRLGLEPSGDTTRSATVAGPYTTTGGLDLTTDAPTVGHTLNVSSGRCVVAVGNGETAKLDTVAVASDPTCVVVLGAGVTLGTLTQNGGVTDLRCAVAGTLTHTAGDLVRTGAGTVATWSDGGGRVTDQGTGTVTAMTAAGSYSYTGSQGCTITTLTGKPGGKVIDRGGKLTFTNAVVFDRCHLPGPPGDVGPAPFYLSVGTGRAVTV